MPKWSLAFISRCAWAASASGRTVWITGRSRPAASALAEALAETPHDGRLLSDRAAAQRRADDREPAREQEREIEIGLRAAHEADLDQTSLDGQGREILRQVAAADVVEDHVDAVVTGERMHARGEVLRVVVDRVAGAELDASLAPSPGCRP